MSAADIVARLSGVIERGPNKWVAKCPAHDDRRPSLSVRELDDGTVLLHDFAGCNPLDICTAIGITFADLFPARSIRRVDLGIRRCVLSASERLELLEHETGLALLILAAFERDHTISHDDLLRLAECANRIGSARHV
jgi:hypothetical protein